MAALALAATGALAAAPCTSGGPDGGPGAEAAPAQAAPSLLVLVVVDQLRGDLLERYDSLFTGGFRRLADEGRVWTGASHRHAFTETAAGHATIATGVHPARHGIVANAFAELQDDGTLRGRYAVGDTASPLIGFPAMEGRSPATLLRSGLADWVLDADPAARVFSASTKDRAAVTLGGRQAAERVHAYWLNVPAARFVTSSFYRDGYPAWVERFNRERMPLLLNATAWESRVPEAARALARPDSAPWEGDGVHVTFPHLRDAEYPGDRAPWWVGGTPFPDAAVLALAADALVELELGRRGALDLLALSFSQVDYVGHAYGPLSQEQLDNLLRLDEVLGQLLTLLDERVGEGRWTLGFTADHGVLTIPEHLAETGVPGRRSPPDYGQELARRVQEATAAEGQGAAEGPEREAVQRRVAASLEELDWVADVLLPSELEGESADSFRTLYRNSYRTDRRHYALAELDLVLRPAEHALLTTSTHGTSHGSPYWYDRWVPFVLLGPGVEPGRSDEPVWTVDLAPSLAALAGIAFPDDLDGAPRGGGG